MGDRLCVGKPSQYVTGQLEVKVNSAFHPYRAVAGITAGHVHLCQFAG